MNKKVSWSLAAVAAAAFSLSAQDAPMPVASGSLLAGSALPIQPTAGHGSPVQGLQPWQRRAAAITREEQPRHRCHAPHRTTADGLDASSNAASIRETPDAWVPSRHDCSC